MTILEKAFQAMRSRYESANLLITTQVSDKVWFVLDLDCREEGVRQ